MMILALYNIRSLHNVGSIFRTADGAGIEKIYLCGITPEPLDRFGRYRAGLCKVSLGAEKTVRWEKIKSAARLIKKLRREGYEIFGVEQSKKSIPYFKVKTGRNTALILGGEVEGVPVRVLKMCDKILEIPMAGRKESLNVSVAAGIVIFGLLYK